VQERNIHGRCVGVYWKADAQASNLNGLRVYLAKRKASLKETAPVENRGVERAPEVDAIEPMDLTQLRHQPVHVCEAGLQ
jgi:hypothetical protein